MNDTPRRFYAHIDLTRIPGLFDAAGKFQKAEAGPTRLTVPVLPEGEFEHPYYDTLTWDRAKFANIRRNFDNRVMGYEPMLNLDHSSLNPLAAHSEAAGWPQSLEHREGDGLYADVELTDLGEEKIASRRYRYISAEFADEYTNSKGEVFKHVLTGMALTNTPFHDTMPALFGGKPVKAIALSQKGGHTWFAAEGAEGAEGGEDEDDRLFAKIGRFIGRCLQAAQNTEEPATHSTDDTEADMPENEEQVQEAAATAPVAEATPAPTPAPAAQPAPEPVAASREAAAAAPAIELEDAEGRVVLSAAEIRQLRQQAAAGVKAQQAMMKQAAKGVTDRYVKAGTIPASKAALAVELAEEKGAEWFTKFFGNWPQTHRLPIGEELGFAGDGAERPEVVSGEHDGIAETSGQRFGSSMDRAMEVIGRFQDQGMDLDQALSRFGDEHPDLYNQYRREVMGRR